MPSKKLKKKMDENVNRKMFKRLGWGGRSEKGFL